MEEAFSPDLAVFIVHQIMEIAGHKLSMTNRSAIALTTISDSTIYAGTDNGVYVSYDNSNSGEQINSGLTESLIYSLSLDKAGYLFAGTNNGIFRSVESVTSIDEELENLPLNFTLNQNYPNPFNPSTTINFSIPETSFITLEVFNALGERVGVLASDELSAGTYKHNWNAAELTSGVYFYRLQAGSTILQKLRR